MDKKEEVGLRELYKEMPEQQLIDLFSEDEENFKEGAYVFLIEEARHRGLEEKLNETRKVKEEKELAKKQAEYKFIRVYSTPKLGEIAVIKSILDSGNTPYYIKGENFATIYGSADGLSSMDVMVKEDYCEDVKELLKDFISHHG